MVTRDLLVATGIGTVVFVAHLLSPIRTSFDSRWTIPTAVSLAYRGDADLEEYDVLVREDENYGIELRAGRRYSRYPIGPSLLAVPVVLAYDLAAGLLSRPSAEELIAQRRAVVLEVVVAALVVALTTAVLFATARRRDVAGLPAALLAMVFAFGTPAWSTASRGLWQHGPSMLMLALAVYLLLLARRRPAWAIVAALPLAFGVLVRPTNAIALLTFTAYVAIGYRRCLLWFLLLAGSVLGVFAVLNLRAFGAPLPSYFLPSGQEAGAWADLPWVFAGHLVSPNRGLLVFSPILVLALAGVVLQFRRRAIDLLDATVIVVVAAHFLAISHAGHWWAGHSFGPRFTTDVLPLLAYLMMPAVAAITDPRRRRARVLVPVAVLVAWSCSRTSARPRRGTCGRGTAIR